jgi:hypothetical protein
MTTRQDNRAADRAAKERCVGTLRTEAREVVQMVHAAADALDCDAIIATARKLRSITWRLARLGVALHPEDLVATDVVREVS